MRKSIAVACHGNSYRITFPPAVLRYLGWVAGTELMLVVRDKHHVEIVDLDTYITETAAAQRAQQLAAPAQVPA